MKTKLQVIKIGGNIIDNEKALDAFLEDFSNISTPKILVHGGGKQATAMSKKLGITTTMNDGRRITSAENLEVVTMVYAGLINKKISGKLQGKGCNAIGLSGADGNSILAKKRVTTPIDYGLVGDVETVNTSFIHQLLMAGSVPVFSAICHDGKGQLLNTNADTIASEIAIAMSEHYATELIYCFEKNGVLENVNDNNSVMEQIDTTHYHELKKRQLIVGGMLPKMENCFHALHHKVSKVIIGNAQVINSNGGVYTTLTR